MRSSSRKSSRNSTTRLSLRLRCFCICCTSQLASSSSFTCLCPFLYKRVRKVAVGYVYLLRSQSEVAAARPFGCQFARRAAAAAWRAYKRPAVRPRAQPPARCAQATPSHARDLSDADSDENKVANLIIGLSGLLFDDRIVSGRAKKSCLRRRRRRPISLLPTPAPLTSVSSPPSPFACKRKGSNAATWRRL